MLRAIKQAQVTIYLFSRRISYSHFHNQRDEIITITNKNTSKYPRKDKIRIESSYNEERPLKMSLRPPIVTIMGHVDHGKTTLLDSLRNANVAENEPGLITQHVSSFVVNFEGRDVTFIDTPGHAAFAGIRGRGAKINDITVLVVDTNEGIKPQTQEVIDLILKYEIPTIIALNKIDRKTSNIASTEEQLVDAGIELESYGGKTKSVQVSGLKRLNLDKLVRRILELADQLELYSMEDIEMKGRILEVDNQLGRGSIATVLVERGLLTIGSVLQTDTAWCKVKQILTPEGMDKSIFENGGKPGYPFQVIGWKHPPEPGAIVRQIGTEKTAKINFKKSQSLNPFGEHLIRTGEDKVTRKFADESQTLYLVVKTDTASSLEALLSLLTSGVPKEVKIEIVKSGVGSISQSDLIFADYIGAQIIGFNIELSNELKKLHTSLRVPIFTHNVVYSIIDYVRNELEAKLEPEYREEVVGEANVLKLFKIPGKKQASGCIAISGRIEKSGNFRVYRKNDLIFEGNIETLQHKKTKIQKIDKGKEFGVSFQDFNDCFEDDRIFCYQMLPFKRNLVWDIRPNSTIEQN